MDVQELRWTQHECQEAGPVERTAGTEPDGTPEPERSAALVVRVWQPRSQELRARITHTQDLSGRNEVVLTTTDPEEVIREVQRWLRAFSRG